MRRVETKNIDFAKVFFKRDTDREKVGESGFLKINTTRTDSPKTKEGCYWGPVRTKMSIFPMFFNRAISGHVNAMLKSMQHLRNEIETIIRNLEVKLQSSPKVLIFIGFFECF